jgi:hypothetical protein
VFAVFIEAVLRVGRRALKSKLAVVIGRGNLRLGYAMGGHAAHGNQARDFLYNAINSPQARSAPSLL